MAQMGILQSVRDHLPMEVKQVSISSQLIVTAWSNISKVDFEAGSRSSKKRQVID